MKAFLSHSSKDKWFVGQVFDALGSAQAEYDERTFDFTLNAQAIRQALKRSELFVRFLSDASANSTFVAEEERQALEAMGRGQLRRVLVIAIDETSYRKLPEWLREINVVQRVSTPRLAASRIQSLLIDLRTERDGPGELFVNRDDELQSLRRVLSSAPGTAPVVLHVTGYHGIGRRTLLKETLRRLYPRITTPIEITFGSFDGAEELYRQLFDLHRVTSMAEKIEALEHFSKLGEEDQAGLIAGILHEMSTHDEFIVINDEGGLITDDGDYPSYFPKILFHLTKLPVPILGIVQTRRMKFSAQQAYKSCFHIQLLTMRDESIREYFSFKLKQSGTTFTDDQLTQLCELVDGHPFNAKFAVSYVEHVGIQNVIDAPHEIVEWKRKRAVDFLANIEFNETERKIISLALAYRYLANEVLVLVLDEKAEHIALALMSLEDSCCIERRGDYYTVPRPLVDALNRDGRFKMPDDWNAAAAQKMAGLMAEYKDEDQASFAVIEAATLAAVKTGTNAPYISHFLLPSHLLRIGKSYYDSRKWALSLDFCTKAYEQKMRLTVDARVEALRLIGLSAARMDDSARLKFAMDELSNINTHNARVKLLFLQGFDARLRGRFDDAENFYQDAYKLTKNNVSVNRELASIFCNQGRYTEAELHARAAYDYSPSNPFLIDILVRAITGKQSQGLQIDTNELDGLMKALEKYGNAPGVSFFDIAQAEFYRGRKDWLNALRCVNAAISKTPSLLTPLFMRAELHLSCNSSQEAKKDIAEIDRLLNQAGGYSPEDEARHIELRVKLHIEEKDFQTAKDLAERSNVLSSHVSNRLLNTIARAIGFSPEHAPKSLQQWSKSRGKGAGKDG